MPDIKIHPVYRMNSSSSIATFRHFCSNLPKECCEQKLTSFRPRIRMLKVSEKYFFSVKKPRLPSSKQFFDRLAKTVENWLSNWKDTRRVTSEQILQVTFDQAFSEQRACLFELSKHRDSTGSRVPADETRWTTREMKSIKRRERTLFAGFKRGRSV